MMKDIDITWQEESDHSAGESSVTQWQQFNTYGTLCFHTEEPTENTPAMLAWLADNEDSLYKLVCEHVSSVYQELLEDSECMDVFEDEEIFQTRVGDFTEAEMLAGDLQKLMQISTIVMHNPVSNAVGLIFECAWDEEHGVGIVIKDGKVLQCDGAQEAYYDIDFILKHCV